MTKMKKVTKNNLLHFIEWKKAYEKQPNPNDLKKINRFTESVINADKRYFSKVCSYDFSSDQLEYLI